MATLRKELGHAYRIRRNALLRRVRAPLARYIYRLRDGWQVRTGVHLARAALWIKPSSIAASARLHFLYVLNRHTELQKTAWTIAMGDARYRRSQMTLHLLLKAAWILQDEALLEVVMDVLRTTKMAPNNVVFIAMRQGAHPVMQFGAWHLAAQAQTGLIGKNPNHPNQRDLYLQNVQTLDFSECFDIPDSLVAALTQIQDAAQVHRFLARRAVRFEDWRTAWDQFEAARLADPNDARTYVDLADTAIYFPDPMDRIVTTLAQRAEAGVVVQGYDKVLGYKHLLDADYAAYLRLRDAQVSNAAAHQVYGAASRKSMGVGATALQPTKDSAFVIGRDGVSDELRWAYYYGALAKAFGALNISCDPRLHSLFSRSYSTITFYPVARNWGRAQTRGEDIARDRVPNMELAARLDNVAYAASRKADQVMFIEDVPLRDWMARGRKGPPDTGEPRGATLLPDQERAAFWRQKLTKEAKGQLKIGLIWRSGLVDIDRQRHYMQLSDFVSLMDLPVVFYSIQHQVSEEERAEASAMGIRFVDDVVDFYDDFEEIAAMTSALDLVIGISTLPYEMAAAVGTDCWLCAISPLGRWMRLGQDGQTNDRLTRNGCVFFPKSKAGYLADRATRVDSIMSQIESALRSRLASQ